MSYQKFTITNLDTDHGRLQLRSLEPTGSYHILLLRNDRTKDAEIGVARSTRDLDIAATAAAEAGRQSGWVLTFAASLPDLSLKYMGLLCHANHNAGKLYSFRLKDQDMAAIEDLCMHMKREMGGDLQLKEDIVRSLLMVFLMYLNRVYQETMQSAGLEMGATLDQLVNRFFDLLDRHYTEAKLPSDYATRLRVKPAYLNDVLKRNCGYTTSYLIQERIVTEAKSLSRNSWMNMKEISYQLGFDDVSHFSKYFKKFSGKSYTHFRQQAIS